MHLGNSEVFSELNSNSKLILNFDCITDKMLQRTQGDHVKGDEINWQIHIKDANAYELLKS